LLREKRFPFRRTVSRFSPKINFAATDWLTFNAGVRYTHFSAGVVEDKTDPRIGTALRIPKLGWVLRAFYGRYYQAPTAHQRFSGTAAAVRDGAGVRIFLPLHGETDEQREFRLDHFRFADGRSIFSKLPDTRQGISFDHDVLGNSNIFFPLTIERAPPFMDGNQHCIRRASAKTPRSISHVFNQQAEGAGVVTGGLLSDPGQLPATGGRILLSRPRPAQHRSAQDFRAALPFRIFRGGANLSYGSGFLNGDGPYSICPITPKFSFPPLSKSIGERLSVGFYGSEHRPTDATLLDNSNTFGGTHWN